MAELSSRALNRFLKEQRLRSAGLLAIPAEEFDVLGRRLKRELGIDLKGWDECPPTVVTPCPGDGIDGAWFDVDAVVKAVRAMCALRHTKGRWAGRPLKPDPWQIVWFLAPVFGWRYSLTDPDEELAGWRIVREAYIEIPRKNGKSTLSSAIALVLLAADGEQGGEVYAAAASKDQAKIVFAAAKSMANGSPELRRKTDRLNELIRHPKSESIMRVITSDGDINQGLNPHGSIIDERNPHNPPAIWNFDRTLEKTVPIQETTSDSNAQPQYLALMAFVPRLNEAGKFDRVDALPAHDARSCGIDLLDAEPGVRLRANPGHLFALNHFTGADSAQPPVYDWQDLIFTVAAHTDERLQIDVPLTGNAGSGKRLVLDVPDAQTWLVINGTVTGVVEGVLQRRQAASQVVRDDKSKLIAVATVAREWYGEARASVSLELQDMVVYEPGMYVRDLANSNQLTPVGTVITRVTHDYAKLTTTIETGYANLDPIRMISASRGSRRSQGAEASR